MNDKYPSKDTQQEVPRSPWYFAAKSLLELAETQYLFDRPRHPYTEALMEAVPEPTPRAKGKRKLLQGEVADPSNLPPGCAFHPRCRHCRERCRVEMPKLRSLENGHLSACHFAEKIVLMRRS